MGISVPTTWADVMEWGYKIMAWHALAVEFMPLPPIIGAAWLPKSSLGSFRLKFVLEYMRWVFVTFYLCPYCLILAAIVVYRRLQWASSEQLIPRQVRVASRWSIGLLGGQYVGHNIALVTAIDMPDAVQEHLHRFIAWLAMCLHIGVLVETIGSARWAALLQQQQQPAPAPAPVHAPPPPPPAAPQVPQFIILGAAPWAKADDRGRVPLADEPLALLPASGESDGPFQTVEVPMRPAGGPLRRSSRIKGRPLLS